MADIGSSEISDDFSQIARRYTPADTTLNTSSFRRRTTTWAATRRGHPSSKLVGHYGFPNTDTSTSCRCRLTEGVVCEPAYYHDANCNWTEKVLAFLKKCAVDAPKLQDTFFKAYFFFGGTNLQCIIHFGLVTLPQLRPTTSFHTVLYFQYPSCEVWENSRLISLLRF